MTYRPCCPQRTYPQQRVDFRGLSPSGFHTASRTWAGYNSYLVTPPFTFSSYWNYGINIDDGTHAYNLIYQPPGSTSQDQWSFPTSFGPMARDHAGNHYWLFQRSNSSQDPRQDATIFDIPATIGSQHTGVYTLEMAVVPPEGYAGYMTESVVLLRDEGFVYQSGGFNHGSTKNTFDVSIMGLDWSPFDDCLYAAMGHKDSNHTLVATGDVPQGGYDPIDAVAEFWRINFDGSSEVIWTLDLETPFGQATTLTVASDGAVWFVTSGEEYQIWRYHNGTVSEVVPDGGPYSLFLSSLGATPWGDVLVPYTTGSGFSLQNHLLMLSPDGSVIPFTCPAFSGDNRVVGMMRQEDFMKLYVFTTPGGSSRTLHELDWKRCGSGWRVGGM